jgi:DNA-binding NtrC family response regulator
MAWRVLKPFSVMTHGNILLVDDDPGFLTALTKTLSKRGYAVTTAADAACAVKAITNGENQFDLVITDLSMPKINGLTVLIAIKTAFPRIQVIVITAFGNDEIQEKAMREGAFAFVHKPLNSNDFLGLVGNAIKAGKPPI